MSVGVGTVRYLHLTSGHGSVPRTMSEVTAVVDVGIAGDVHAKKARRRQVLLVDMAVLASVGLEPGALREQITVDFPELNRLSVGAQLRIGQVSLEVTGPCDPCAHIGTLAGATDPGALQTALAGRRGVLARVTAIAGNGTIRVGDSIAAIDARNATGT